MTEYYTVPALVGTNPTPGSPLVVKDFLIGRKGYGEITFPGYTDLINIDLRSVVRFGRRNVTVYPVGFEEPPVGFGLNKTAVVTLHGVWPRKQSNNPVRYRTYLQKVTKTMGALFLDYLPDTGSWVFKVPHFSKYGLNDSDEEADAAINEQKNNRLARVQGQNLTNGAEFARKLNGQVGQVPGEETIPKSLLFDSSLLSNQMDGEFSHELDPRLQGLDDLNRLNKSDIMSPNKGLLNFGVPINNERLCEMKIALFEDNDMEHMEYEEQRKKFRNEKSILGSKTVLFDSNYMEEEESLPEPTSIRFGIQTKVDEHPSILTLQLSSMDYGRDLPVIQTVSVDSPIYRTPRKLTTAKGLENQPYVKSLLFNRENLVLDSGCFKNVSYRVGWGPNMSLVHKSESQPQVFEVPGQFSIMSHSSVKTISTSQSYLHCSKLDSASVKTSVFCSTQNLVENLMVQLKHNLYKFENDVPLFYPDSAEENIELLNAHFKVAREQSSQGATLDEVFTIWNLCTALWGYNEEEKRNSYNYNLYRKEVFSQWLISTTSSKLEQEVQNTRSHLSAIFSLMTGNCIKDACAKAHEFDDLRIGLLLSQAGTFSSVRIGVLKQLENWSQFEVDRFIDDQRIKIYALLAGKLVWKTQQGNVINCCEDLDWKRSLALHLWYHCLPTASIEESLAAYEEAFQGSGPNGQYATMPYPPYIQNNPELYQLARETETPPFDICYYLLKLYCDKSTPLAKLLVPLTYGPSQLDYSLSWMVYQVLLSLGYQHLPFFQSHLLHVNFASQLEAVGLWEWAVFVLLHITETSRRKTAVMEVLMRHVSLNPEEGQIEIENFLKEKLLIPNTWIFAAKAVLAKAMGNYRDEAWCLLKSQQWSKSHQIILEKIAPDCIIHEQFDYLKSFLTEMSSPEISSTILGWSNGGEVYLDYIHISEKIEQLMSGQVKSYEIEELHPKVVSLSNRICNLQCLCAKDRLCQSEMSKKTVTLFRALLTLRQNVRSGLPSGNQLLSNLLPKLPMPEDYALQEMKATVRSYMLEVTNAVRDS